MKPSLIDLPRRPQGLRFDLKPVAGAAFNVELRQSEAEIQLFGVVGLDVTDAQIAAALRQAGGLPVTISINSPGGDYYTGLAIYNQLTAHSARVTVKVLGIAASAASIIAMAGHRIEMMRGAEMMVHNAWAISAGDNRVMAEAAEFLRRLDTAIADIYARRTGQPADVVRRMMDAETFLDATQAVELGFADATADGEPAERPRERKPADARTEREFEQVLRDLGFARAAAARLAAGGWAELKKHNPDQKQLEPVAARMAAILSKVKGIGNVA